MDRNCTGSWGHAVCPSLPIPTRAPTGAEPTQKLGKGLEKKKKRGYMIESVPSTFDERRAWARMPRVGYRCTPGRNIRISITTRFSVRANLDLLG